MRSSPLRGNTYQAMFLVCGALLRGQTLSADDVVVNGSRVTYYGRHSLKSDDVFDLAACFVSMVGTEPAIVAVECASQAQRDAFMQELAEYR